MVESINGEENRKGIPKFKNPLFHYNVEKKYVVLLKMVLEWFKEKEIEIEIEIKKKKNIRV